MNKGYLSIIRNVDQELKNELERSDKKITLFLLGPGDDSTSNGKKEDSMGDIYPVRIDKDRRYYNGIHY